MATPAQSTLDAGRPWGVIPSADNGWSGETLSRAVAELQRFDDRHTHIITRGNVDGIISSAFCFAVHPDARVNYAPSATSAVDILRKDLSTRHFYLIDIGLTPRLIKTLNMKRQTGQRITLIDHHQQSINHAHLLDDHVESIVREGGSAASLALDHFHDRGLLAAARSQGQRFDEAGLSRLAAVADYVEYGTSHHLDAALAAIGSFALEKEAEHMDFAWRLEIEDDRFRTNAGRRLASGRLPSQVSEVRRRYLQMVNENRWLRAQERVRSHMVIRNDVAVLNFGKRKPSLLGFGTRALTSVARQEGAAVALLVNRRKDLASIALRATGTTPANLGLFVEEFTRRNGIVGGGHPTSAGAKIHARHLPKFIDELFQIT